MLSFQQTPRTVQDGTEDRQWDCRFNIQEPGYFDKILDGIKSDVNAGRIKWVLVSGKEIGTRSYQDDYEIEHVHVGVIFNDRISKRRILNNWSIKRGNGYYLVPRNRDMPYEGWRNHHIKPFSKIDPEKLIEYEYGSLPRDIKRKCMTDGDWLEWEEPSAETMMNMMYIGKRAEATEEEKKLSADDIFKEIRRMLMDDIPDSQIFDKFPCRS